MQMISFKTGNILESQTEALVNTVNTVGVMGKGIALAFKKTFPIVMKEYLNAIENGSFQIGNVQVVETKTIQPKYVLNFPTKKHWRHPSKIEYIDQGLQDLVNKIIHYNIKSISVPPLGCGNGKLEWNMVKPLMLKHFDQIADDVNIIIFEPGYSDQTMVQKKEVELTPARAMLIYLLKEYQILGYSVNLLVAQKLAYLLQRFGEPLRLNFEKGPYGPYAHNLLHLLKYLNGSFIWFKQDDNKPGTPVKLDNAKYSLVEDYVKRNISDEQKERLKKVLAIIEGFESPYGLELLATVDFVIQNTSTNNLKTVQENIHNWTTRKREIMKPYHIEVATNQINSLLS